ncbi:MAG: hypothetical protein HOO00_02550 [Rhodospirillaceae bacterium]|nr:hypothetical protein [Rhodospirillaceae bacterium]MBT5373994.1 hypothetical protein [Rhodospirillaceae bacterium]MBT5658614.1 hypothetical protein [Rhodospirillaceae bacterium]MBT5752873.1 hypothetical protein [Rhodospirillaceae bacterium]
MNLKLHSVSIALCALVALALIASPAEAKKEIKNWPCKSALTDDIPASVIWNPAPKLDPSWEEDEGVRKIVQYAIDPANPPSEGKDAIAEYAATLGADKDKRLVQVFTGLLAETNVFHTIVISGIRNFIIKAKILADVVAENDAEINDPNTSAQRKKDVEVARASNFHDMDDAEEEAEFLCHRYDYVEKKLGLLTDQLRAEMTKK